MNRLTRNKILHPLEYRRNRYATRPRDFTDAWTEPMTTHPDYPPHNGDPQTDRCVCGGIRHWHAVDPHGCDDCDCTSFQSSEARE